MKISSVTIEGMHKLGQPKKYTFNNLTYLYGPNGSGKSTVLEAIQLALLGYIPGMNKKNDAIFKHANSSIMRISLVFDNGSSIERRFMNTGKGISTSVITDPEGLDFESIVQDVELPIFNWSDFTGLSANQLKDWFISFLPEACDSIDWMKELTDAVETLNGVNKQKMIADEVDAIQTCARIINADVNSLSFVREVNRMIKDDIACEKANIQRDTATLQNLTKYDDVPEVSYSQIQTEIEEATAKRNRLVASRRQFEQNVKIAAEVQSLNLSAESLEEDGQYIRLQDKLTEINKQLSEIDETYTVAYKTHMDAEKALSDATLELKIASASLRVDSSGVCPFTNEECSTAAEYIESKKAEIQQADIELNSAREQAKEAALQLEHVAKQKTSLASTAQDLMTSISKLKNMYERANQLNNLLVPVDGTDLLDVDPEVIRAEIDNKMQMLRKISANEAYDSMADKITKSKFAAELRLSMLKNWEKLTGPNGLQTRIMDKPFLNLADELSAVLTKLMNEPVSAKFNLSEKANSFSFGIVRDEKYIPFEVLSSGEQCMYVVAMMIHIVRNAKSSLKVILVDDLLDHLDDNHMTALLTSLSTIEDIQFILAGAKKYDGDEDVVVSI